MNHSKSGLPDRRDSAVYLQILARLQQGEVALEDRLIDTKLAAELEVSRMPVREALLRLVHEGYLVGTTRGFMLPQLSLKDVAEIFEVRKLLEPHAAALAAYAIDEFGLAALGAAHAKAQSAIKSKDGTALMDANTRFRRTWLQAVPNARLAATISRFVDHVQMIRMRTLHDVPTQEIAMAMLTELLAGFEAHNAMQVHDCMTYFIERARERFFALLPPEGLRVADGEGETR